MQPFPMILVGSEYWGGLTGWIEEQLASASYISDGDRELFRIVDTADEVVDIVRAERRFRGRAVDNVRLA